MKKFTAMLEALAVLLIALAIFIAVYRMK